MSFTLTSLGRKVDRVSETHPRRLFLVGLWAFSIAVLLLGAALTRTSTEPPGWPLIIGYALWLLTWWLLRRRTRGIGDSPLGALDEWERSLRARANQIAVYCFTVGGVFVSFYLLLADATTATAERGGYLLLGVVLLAVSAPNAYLGWTMPTENDDDPV